MAARTSQDETTFYQALLAKDTRLDGLVFAGIKTTGIFCRLSCHARKPRRENVEFFRTVREALASGYRPCRLCQPAKPPGAAPDWLKPLLDEIDADPSLRITAAGLRERGLEPDRVRRWFQKTHGLTFHAYLRQSRIAHAFGRLQGGEEVTATAFDSGFESLSGFGEMFRKIMGFSPRESASQTAIVLARIPTPLGPAIAGATGEGLCLLEFSDRPMLETQFRRLYRYFKAPLVFGQSPFFPLLQQQLSEYFQGNRTGFTIPLSTNGTPFQQQVWQALQQIPYGQTRSYKQQAESIGLPRAIRAVARANGDNRISILIPCHRVIGEDGRLTGYGGGLWRKKHLLDLERQTAART